MKHLAIARLMPWLLLAVCPPLLGHCGGATELGTETGNPPVVESRKFHVVAHGAQVEVIGDAGAVSPGADVRVTNRSSGESAAGTARADGSLSVLVPGSLQDEYEVTVTLNGGSQTLRLAPAGGLAPTGNGGTTSSAGPPVPSCAELQATLADRVRDGFAAADRACTKDSDCAYTGWGVGCSSLCGNSILSAAGVAAARAFVTEDTALLCSELEGRCEPVPPSPCPPGNPTPECRAGLCQPFDPDTLTCQELSDKASLHLNEVVEAADHTCTRDADCTLVTANVTCAGSCGGEVAVASSVAGLLPPDIQRVEATYCPFYVAHECPVPSFPPCTRPAGEPQASCNAGRCDVIFVE